MKRFSLVVLFCCLFFIGLSGFEPSDVVIEDCGAQKFQQADCAALAGPGAGHAKNVILLIGDGMGIGQVYAGRVYVNGPDEPFAWEQLPHTGLVKTCAIGMITDSAASGTAMATGYKTSNGAISTTAAPIHDEVPNILDMIHDKKAIGVVTTTSVWDATPAAFVTHAPSRAQDTEIARQMIRETRPEVIMGGGANAFEGPPGSDDLVKEAASSGYAVVRTREELLALDAGSAERVLGLFAPSKLEFEIKRPEDTAEPHLSDMAKVALDVLDNDPRGFFIMIEGARIDHSSHETNVKKVAPEVAEFNKTIEMALAYADSHPGTLVVITADHETGGIVVRPKDYEKGDLVKIKWTKAVLPGIAGHSSQRVPIYATGPNADEVKERMDNTEVMCVIKNAFGEK